MTTTLPNKPSRPQIGSPVHHDDDVPSVEEIKQKILLHKLKTALALAERVKTMPDGSRVIVRFTPVQRLEHQVLIITFSTLAITGLLQRYSQFDAVALIIKFLGDIDALRVIHHLAAVIFIFQSIYHVLALLNTWFVKIERGHMWPQIQDFKNLLGMVKYNLGLVAQRPEFDRYTVEEKLEYWALLWGTPLMIITGVVMWFPIQTTTFLPGYAIPVARALHGWEAVLATLAILVWHMYHTVIKERNTSIFTGVMPEEAMQHEHPLEYQRIMAAFEYVQTIQTQTAQQVSPKSNNKVSVVSDTVIQEKNKKGGTESWTESNAQTVQTGTSGSSAGPTSL